MLQIKTMRYEDIPFAIDLTDHEKWGIPRRDFERILRLDPRGSFIAFEGNRKVGLATTTSYGTKLAWIGNVIVDRNYRGKSIGRRLVEHAITYLRKLRAEHIALYCFKENVNFYQNLGFVKNSQFVRLRRRAKSVNYRRSRFNLQHRLLLNKMLLVDKIAFGADRSRLIRLILANRVGWYLGFSRNLTHTSYLMVREYDAMYEFGPWVCVEPRKSELAELLLQALSITGSRPVEVSCLRGNRRARALLKNQGFRRVREGYRMYFDDKPRIGNDVANYALGFLDKG